MSKKSLLLAAGLVLALGACTTLGKEDRALLDQASQNAAAARADAARAADSANNAAAQANNAASQAANAAQSANAAAAAAKTASDRADRIFQRGLRK